MNSTLQGKKWTDWIQIVVIALSIIMIFTGFVTFKSDTIKWKVKSTSQKALSQVERLDLDEIEDAVDDLQDLGIYVSPSKAIKAVKQVCKILKDGKFSPVELGIMSGAYIVAGADKIRAVEDVLYSGINVKYARFLEALSDAIVMMVIVAIISVVYLVISIIALIKKLQNNDTILYVYAGTGIVLTIFNLILVSKFNSAFETIAYDYNYGWGNLFAVTFTSFLPLIFGVCTIVLRVFGGQIGTVPYMKLGNASVPRASMNPKPVVPAGDTVTCPTCGGQVSRNSKFCPACGGTIQAEPMHVCPNCHAQIGEDTTFCPSCGAKCK